MAQSKSVRLTKEQADALEDMVDRDEADNPSEAFRMFVNAGMREYGYGGNGYSETWLKFCTHRAGMLLTVAGMVGLSFTFMFPVAARIPSFAVLVAGVGLYGLYGVLDKHEPKVSNKLKRIFSRGETA